MNYAEKLFEKRSFTLPTEFAKGYMEMQDNLVSAVLKKNEEIKKEVAQFVKDAKENGYSDEVCESIRKARTVEGENRAFREMVKKCEELKK